MSNMDGKVIFSDLTFEASQSGPQKTHLFNADVNRDGYLNILDLTLAANVIYGE